MSCAGAPARIHRDMKEQGSAADCAGGGGMGSALWCTAMFAGMRVWFVVLVVGLFVGPVSRVPAIDRWSALSQIESADDDAAVGAAGEISRFQIRPEVWRRYAPADADWMNPTNALSVARLAMQERCSAFERAVHRPPTDSEFYILWNAPAQVQRPTKAVLGRAERFCNLVNSR
jgi:hypothetical protein